MFRILYTTCSGFLWRVPTFDIVAPSIIISWRHTAVVNPILRVVFLEPNYEVTRNEFGVVLRKTVDAMIIFKVKSSGQCHMRWHSFGYESMGGGAFSDEVKPWEKQERIGFDFYPQHILLPGDRKIYAGREYVVDCDAFN